MRGNAPRFLAWRVEGAPIPPPAPPCERRGEGSKEEEGIGAGGLDAWGVEWAGAGVAAGYDAAGAPVVAWVAGGGGGGSVSAAASGAALCCGFRVRGVALRLAVEVVRVEMLVVED